MQYTLEELKALLDNPVDHRKWGDDTSKIISILRIIFNAGCSSCMFRRKVSELRELLERHGDTINTIKHYIENPDTGGAIGKTPQQAPSSRIPCPDCVAKHLSEAFVLQCEFYQGYTDYISLIEAHLNEAIAECPKNNYILIRILHNCLRNVIVDGEPNIPIVLADNFIDHDSVSKNPDNVVCAEIDKDMIINTVYRIHITDLKLLHSIFNKMPEYTEDSESWVRFDWGGRMALAADIFSRYSRPIAGEIRTRRLKYFNNPVPSDHIFMYCTDIVDSINSVYTSINDIYSK